MSSLNVIVGISGGVDSAVAAALLVEQGHRVSGLFMKNWDDDDGTEYCTAAADLLDAERICHALGIDLEVVSFAQAYRANVFAHFLDEYRAGRTPNPDVACNREIKFSVFADHARRLGGDWVATGHYARIDHTPAGPRLHKGRDPAKDQSYFLQAVPREQLRRVMFPLGELRKDDVRAIARRLELPVADKPDSTGICFIGERRFREFLSRYVQTRPGLIRSVEGVVIGEHPGAELFTIGQREGLGVGGTRHAGGAPWYVVAKDTAANELIVAPGSQHPALFSNWLSATGFNWFERPARSGWRACTARIRHRQADQGCRVRRRADGQWLVEFEAPQRAVTPGQWVCLYDGTQCLGGGVITAAGVPSA